MLSSIPAVSRRIVWMSSSQKNSSRLLNQDPQKSETQKRDIKMAGGIQPPFPQRTAECSSGKEIVLWVGVRGTVRSRRIFRLGSQLEGRRGHGTVSFHGFGDVVDAGPTGLHRLDPALLLLDNMPGLVGQVLFLTRSQVNIGALCIRLCL